MGPDVKSYLLPAQVPDYLHERILAAPTRYLGLSFDLFQPFLLRLPGLSDALQNQI